MSTCNPMHALLFSVDISLDILFSETMPFDFDWKSVLNHLSKNAILSEFRDFYVI